MKFVSYVFRGSSSPCSGGGKSHFAFGLLAVIFALAVVIESVESAFADAVTFIDPTATLTTDAEKGITANDDDSCTIADGSYTQVAADSNNEGVTWSNTTTNGWYVLNSNITVEGVITVTGAVNLILCNGVTLTAKGGVKVEGTENSLTIYGQASSNGTYGTLTTYVGNTSNVGANQAGIGASGENTAAGNITINGGAISVKGGEGAPGIGSVGTPTAETCEITINGNESTISGVGLGVMGGKGAPSIKAKSITFNAPYLTTNAGDSTITQAGADAGTGIDAETVTIQSGIITVRGGTAADGIKATSVTVNGGILEAEGGAGDETNTTGGNGINCTGTVSITGGQVKASGGTGSTAGTGITAASLSLGYDAKDINLSAYLTNGQYYHSLFATSYSLTDNNFTVAEKNTFVYHTNEDATEATALTVGTDNKVSVELATLANQYISPKVYAVTFDLNYENATGAPETQRLLADADEKKATEPTVPTRESYKFKGWYIGTKDGDNVTLADQAYDFNTTVTADMTLYAGWDEIWTITFNANYENADPATATQIVVKTAADNVALEDNTFTREGYTFVGWATEATGAKVYDDKGTIAKVEADLQLYALWANNTCKVTFNANYGDEASTTTQDITATETAEALNGTFTRIGYTLAGWNTEATPTTENPGTSYTTAQEVTIFDLMDNTTLYAQWKLIRYEITYSGVDGATNDNPATYSIASEDFTLNAPTKKGSRFTGWTYTGQTTPEKTVTVEIVKTQEPTALEFTANWTTGFSPNDENTPQFAGNSLMLGDQIGVMFYVYFPDEETANKATIVFDVSGDKSQNTENATYDTESVRDYDGYTVYGYKCYINSVQMADKITATLTYDDTKDPLTKLYSADKYLTLLTADTEGTTYGAKAVALGKAIKDYGHYVQLMLQECHDWTLGTDYKAIGYGTKEYTASDVPAASTLSSYEISDTLDSTTDSGISEMNFSLLLDTRTTIRLYFTPKSDYTGTITVKLDDETSGTTLSEKVGANYVYDIGGISAHLLGSPHKLTVTTEGTDNSEVSFTITNLSAMSYVYSVLKDAETDGTTVTDAMKYGVTALRNYFTATTDYRNNKDYDEQLGSSAPANEGN